MMRQKPAYAIQSLAIVGETEVLFLPFTVVKLTQIDAVESITTF